MFLKDKRRTAPTHVQDYLKLLDRYAKALDDIKVVDPACGSGAFLIQAFNRLLEERQPNEGICHRCPLYRAPGHGQGTTVLNPIRIAVVGERNLQ